MLSIEAVGASDLDMDEVIHLYESVGWAEYTKAPNALWAALSGSSTVVVAREGPELVGLARVISDGSSICYLQDVLVRPSHHGRGIGRALVERVLAPYAHVRQKVLITDDEPQQRAFYEALGYTRSDEVEAGPIRAFVRFD